MAELKKKKPAKRVTKKVKTTAKPKKVIEETSSVGANLDELTTIVQPSASETAESTPPPAMGIISEQVLKVDSSPEANLETISEPVSEITVPEIKPDVKEEPLSGGFPTNPVEPPPSANEIVFDAIQAKEIPEALPKERGGKSRYFWVAGFVIIAFTAVLGSYYIYTSSVGGIAEEEELVTPMPVEVVEEPESTQTPVVIPVDRSSYSITILNGSGINGEAARAQGVLEAEEYTVSEIGNAESLVSETEITVGEEVSADYIEELKSTLAKTYTVSEEINVDDSVDQVTIIIGGDSGL